MKQWNKIKEWFGSEGSIRKLVIVVLVLLIVWLFNSTKTIWLSLVRSVWAILKPFVYGFSISFIFVHPIHWLEKKKVPKNIAIFLVYGIVLLALFLLIANLIPVLTVRLSAMINSIISAVNELYMRYSHYLKNDNDTLAAVVRTVIRQLSSLQNVVPGVTSELPSVFNKTISGAITFIFSLVISIFMSFQWNSIQGTFAKYSRKISSTGPEVTFAIANEVQTYIHSLLVLMIIKIIEYAIVYSLFGHPDWFILCILTGLALLVPYLGPMLVYGLAILTAVGMPTSRFTFLIIVILILANVDDYVISPLVHARNTAITPLWVLFSIMVGNTLFGIIGVIMAIPVYLAIHKYLELLKYRKDS
ncbi:MULTISPECIES: AI-2E family transporter [Terrabacteria group]|uniref:AI-2E family transporter n=1 Tax=Bacillati TaxID=1783272 RepID=UPI0019394696|nr:MULTISPECIES: AI-2E family transporter [Terrabacteria group]MBW9212035.1 AI-2E family transporter [Trueperella sp. zg.1013]QRG87158.1 AI-2E family transporter [Bulleidia sp. zg-1006]